MDLRGKKLGVLLSVRPGHPNFGHILCLAETALDAGVQVYLYCVDDAVWGLSDTRLQALKTRGLKLFACAYGAQRRQIPLSDLAIFAGLTTVSDIMTATDRFVSFN